MSRFHLGSPDLADTSVGREDNDWCEVALKRSVHVREAFNVEHVDLIDEEDTWDELGATLLSPLGNFLINLLTDLRLDFTNVSCEQTHESL